MNFVDVAAVVVVVATAAFGWRSGLVSQAFGFFGLALAVASIVVLARVSPDALETLDPLTRLLVVIGVFFVALAVGQVIGARLTAAIRPRSPGALQTADSLGGAGIGVVRGVVSVWLIGGILVATPVPRVSAEARRSVVLHELDERFPSSVVVLGEIARAVDTAGLPELFVELVPAPAVRGPEQREAERIASRATASTLRVEAASCFRLQSGTAFAVAPGVFVTNAHVVAGSGDVELSSDRAFERFDADVVLFDAALDLAVLRAPDVTVAPLELAAAAPDRGDASAALGHTGGGRLRTIPAVVSRTLGALGRDIYGRSVVRREVVEIRGDVRPGDSGGPLILADGTVGGVIFSESRVDRSVGYALAPEAVRPKIARALRATSEVDTGDCLPDSG